MHFIGESLASARIAQEWRRVPDPLRGLLTPAFSIYLRTIIDMARLLSGRNGALTDRNTFRDGVGFRINLT